MRTRELPDGYQVFHHDPDDKHPHGKKVLCPGQSRLRQRLLDAHPQHQETHAGLRERHETLVARRRNHLAANPAVPASKRCC